MSWWTIRNNSFYDSHTGVLIGGGRNVTLENNYFQLNRSDALVVHMDARGLGWQKDYCHTLDVPALAAQAKVPAWSKTFSYLALALNDSLCTPIHNKVIDNTYCFEGATG